MAADRLRRRGHPLTGHHEIMIPLLHALLSGTPPEGRGAADV